VASDTNDCTRPATPCATFQEVANRWGTLAPRLRQSTTITFLSSQVSGNDPVRLDPVIEDGALVTLQGALGPAQAVASGTLSNVVPKDTHGGQMLRATLPAGVGPGELVVDTTQASRAWVYASAGGGDWYLSQPILQESTPPTWNPVEVSWYEGDAITVYQPVTVNLVEASPILADCDNGYACTNDLLVTQLTVLDPNGPNVDPLTIGDSVHVSLLDASVQRVLTVAGGAADWYPNYVNVDFAGALNVDLPAGYVYLYGGQIRPSAAGSRLVGALLADDIAVGASLALGDGMFGAVYLDQGAKLTASTGVDWWWSVSGWFDGVASFYGPGAVDVAAGARLEYAQGYASGTFLQTGGLTLGGQSTACAVDTGGSGQPTCGIALTPANLDTDIGAGGFGGSAVGPGGGSLSDVKF
jgi:hypothetical protein